MYDRLARRAEAGMDGILYIDLDGGFPVKKYWGATRKGSLTVIIASETPIAEANTVLYASSSKRKKGYVIDASRSYTNIILNEKG